MKPILCPECAQFSLHGIMSEEDPNPVLYMCEQCNSSYSPHQYHLAVLARDAEEQVQSEHAHGILEGVKGLMRRLGLAS